MSNEWPRNRHPPERGAEEAQEVAAKILAALGAEDIRSGALGYARTSARHPPHGQRSASSVVDANLRAHDVPNLYLVGGGCFVTVSSSPPTLTIAALAIRAAEHIAEVYRGQGAGRRAHRSGSPTAGVTT
jgi:glucose dehydrogenase